MADVSVPTFKKRANKSSNVRKRPATPPPEASDSDADETDYTDDESGTRVKRRKTNGVAIAAPTQQAPRDLNKSTKYEADRSTTIAVSDFATKTSNLYAADAKSDKREQDRGDGEEAEQQSDGKYRGTSSYGSFIQKNANAPNRSVGPMKAPTNVRTITTTDFAPDVCKDYKQTGFCGFGDGCKFLHAREDYAQGWQLDRDWEKTGKTGGSKAGSAQTGGSSADAGDENKMLEDIPFACIICKQDYVRPIVTRCGHYFCEKCAMQRYMRDKKRTCANCGADTNGTFNVARKLKELLEKKKKRADESSQAVEDGNAAAQPADTS